MYTYYILVHNTGISLQGVNFKMLPEQRPNLPAATPDSQDKMPNNLNVAGNINLTDKLFDRNGNVTQFFKEILETLPLFDSISGAHLTSISSTLTLPQVEQYLQAAFFRPNEAKFAYQVATEGELPNERQLAAFGKLGMVDALTVTAGNKYDLGAVFGGLLAAVDARSKYLLQQGVDFSSVALLGGQRPLIESELKENLATVIGQDYYTELEQKKTLPKTEFQMMRCVWDSYCRKNESLSSIPVIEVDSKLRIGKAKDSPHTPDTVVDLANTLTSGIAIPGLKTAPSAFIVSSSQPYAPRQREDFLSAMISLNYPLAEVDVIGYPSSTPSSLKLYATEIAKLVHAQYLTRKS